MKVWYECALGEWVVCETVEEIPAILDAVYGSIVLVDAPFDPDRDYGQHLTWSEMIASSDDPPVWKALDGNTLIQIANVYDDGFTHTKTADEWVAERGRGHLCSENY